MPPLLMEAHAPHSESEIEGGEAMMGGLCRLVVKVCLWGLCGLVVCAASPNNTCCVVRLTRVSAPKIWQPTAYW